MKMTSIKMKRKLDELFTRDDWRVSFNRDKDIYRVEWKDTKQGVKINIPNVIAKYERRGDIALEELQFHVSESLKMMNEEHQLEGKEKHIYPVIRATSFPKKTKSGTALVYTEHTAETNIYYALDLGTTYQLIDENMLNEQGWSYERLKEISLFNIRSLDVNPKKDIVAENDFYFIATQDGYDASRILNEAFLEEMKANAVGEILVAVPHQDVLIVADVKNKMGYDILAQMTMKFFAEGRVPITSLPFAYDEKHLEPVFILAKNKPEK
ncbi:DUF1444 domain-containing protein [Gracilibacillus kekensis]|uniref:UPF0354 protein SAMN05216179_1610 n=1 Tax=Gracilibacillus kekensis TaxID=1027249 RepID=A0A1M7NLD4_9BACI|nr:DUF1444 domain-containing protein [Gracilibacillus kekensis]SHN04551.1 Uncharacterized protein YtpQ, UPF0354 family [Gracilibacillus kekensis]